MVKILGQSKVQWPINHRHEALRTKGVTKCIVSFTALTWIYSIFPDRDVIIQNNSFRRAVGRRSSIIVTMVRLRKWRDDAAYKKGEVNAIM